MILELLALSGHSYENVGRAPRTSRVRRVRGTRPTAFSWLVVTRRSWQFLRKPESGQLVVWLWIPVKKHVGMTDGHMREWRQRRDCFS